MHRLRQATCAWPRGNDEYVALTRGLFHRSHVEDLRERIPTRSAVVADRRLIAQSMVQCITGGRKNSVYLPTKPRTVLLAVWLILYGLAGMIALALPAPLMAVLALLPGILILVGR